MGYGFPACITGHMTGGYASGGVCLQAGSVSGEGSVSRRVGSALGVEGVGWGWESASGGGGGLHLVGSASGGPYWNAFLSFQILGTFLAKGNVNEFIRTDTKVPTIAHFKEIE